MRNGLTPGQTAVGIWGRVIKPGRGTLSTEAARAVLKLDFDADDRRRVDDLSTKAAEGTLSADERAELEEYLRVNNELMVLHSKARLSLAERDHKV